MPAGRPRKPTKVRQAEGMRGHRPLNTKEPQPALSGGKMPTGLSTWGKRLWESVAAELDRLDLLTVVDQGALEAAVCGANQGHEADKRVRLLLEKINRGKGEQEDFYRLSIVSAVSKKGWQQYKAFATEFGLTPASRTRLTTEAGLPSGQPSKTKMDPVEEALCGFNRVQ